jgi:hypothetical protein
MVNTEVLPLGIEVGEKDLLTCPPDVTTTVEEALLVLVTPCAEVRLLALTDMTAGPAQNTLGCPLMTLNWIVQLPFAGMLPPDKVPLVAPGVTVPHVETKFVGVAKAMGWPKLNVVETLVRTNVLGFVSVKMKVIGGPLPSR